MMSAPAAPEVSSRLRNEQLSSLSTLDRTTCGPSAPMFTARSSSSPSSTSVQLMPVPPSMATERSGLFPQNERMMLYFFSCATRMCFGQALPA